MEAYAGIDWDRKKAIAAATDDEGRIRQFNKPIPPTLNAVRDFLDTVLAWNPNANTCRIAIEAGSDRWVRLFHLAGAVVHVIDCKQARRFAESLCSSGAKDDARDACVLAQMVQSPAHRRAPFVPPSEEQAVLLQLTRTHQQVTTDLGRLSNRIRAHLAEHFPALDTRLQHLSPKWVSHLLKTVPTGWHARSLSHEAFEALLNGTGIQARTRVWVWKILEKSEVLIEGVAAETLGWSVGLLLEQYECLQRQLSAVNERLEKQLGGDERSTTLRSVSGIGLHLSAGLLALCFDGLSSGARDSASIRLGSSPVKRHSGQQRSSGVRMRRSTGSRGRQLSYLLGMQAARHLSWAQAMYAHARKHKQSAGTAFRRISRSLLRILTAMLRDGVEYDEARYIRALKAHGVPWAQALEIPSSA